jgi:hypothetical protein
VCTSWGRTAYKVATRRGCPPGLILHRRPPGICPALPGGRNHLLPAFPVRRSGGQTPKRYSNTPGLAASSGASPRAALTSSASLSRSLIRFRSASPFPPAPPDRAAVPGPAAGPAGSDIGRPTTGMGESSASPPAQPFPLPDSRVPVPARTAAAPGAAVLAAAASAARAPSTSESAPEATETSFAVARPPASTVSIVSPASRLSARRGISIYSYYILM